MQPLVILLIAAVVLAGDAGLVAPELTFATGGWEALAIASIPMLAALVGVQGIVTWCNRRVVATASARPILITERLMRGARWFILGNYVAAVLFFGWLDAVRSVVGDTVLLDEILTMSPVLLGLTALWWVYYPVERRLREAVLVRRLDEGAPIYPTPTRGRYVLMQLRIQILLLLVPVLLILAVSEGVDRIALAVEVPPDLRWAVDAATFLGALGIFATAPLLAQVLLSVEPLAEGPLRDDLDEVCRRHGVRVRQVFVWHTSGSMINAAVMGLIGPLRCILLTDALLEMMPRRAVVAVMAHEIGHVRRHHMAWLVVSLIATLAVSVLAVAGPVAVADSAGVDATDSPWLQLAVTVGEVVVALAVFGWICRRFERQADTFAVQHLSGLGDAAPETADVTDEAVGTMRDALDLIARLNAVDPDRRSWRHGSIAWRREYLATLAGRPIRSLPIDRVVRRIKIISAIALVVAVVGVVLLEYGWARGVASDAATTGETTP